MPDINIPEVYMLCGPAGSGKTTYAEELVARGVVKLSLDESMHEKYGQAGIDYPIEDDTELERTVIEEHKERLIGHVAVGEPVVMDYGFARREEREEYKKLIEDSGGQWRLLYFKASLDVLRIRLRARNAETGANAQYVTEEWLQNIIDRFEEPVDESEEIIQAPEDNAQL